MARWKVIVCFQVQAGFVPRGDHFWMKLKEIQFFRRGISRQTRVNESERCGVGQA
jgi:hypothetical protein